MSVPGVRRQLKLDLNEDYTLLAPILSLPSDDPAEDNSPCLKGADKGYLALNMIHEHDQKMLPLRARAEGLLDKKSGGSCTRSSSHLDRSFTSPYASSVMQRSREKGFAKRLDYDDLQT